jgi:hypothetical protein
MAGPLIIAHAPTAPLWKDGQTPKKMRAKRKRADHVTLERARVICEERDGYCRLLVPCRGDDAESVRLSGLCGGYSTLAHLAGARRSKTRNRPSAERHDPRRMAMLCQAHHEREEREGMRLVPLTEVGMDGPIRVQWTPPKPEVRR